MTNNISGGKKGRIYILSGPSGSGKDTILSVLRRRHAELEFSISYVTRPPRPGEVDASAGGKYRFISKEDFLEMLSQGGFLEYNEYLGNYYGTPRAQVDQWLAQGRDVILEIDVNGAKKVREQYPDSVSIFVMPPSLEILKKRLFGRCTEDLDEAQKRLTEAMAEMTRAGEYEYIIINDILDDAVEDIAAIIREKRLHKSVMLKYAEEILKNGNNV